MKRTLITSLIMIFAALIIMIVGFNVPEGSDTPSLRPVLLLVEDDTGAFLLQLRLGAQQAVSELGCDLTVEVVSPGDQLETEWLERQFSGAVVYIEEETLRQSVLNQLDAAALPAVVIGSWNGKHTAVRQNETHLGELAAELAQGYDSILLTGAGADARKAIDTALGAKIVSEAQFNANAPGSCVIALDEASALAWCQRKGAQNLSCALISVDPGETRAEQMNQGIAQAYVLSSPYATGYQAVSEALWQRAPQLYEMSYFSVLPQTMYNAENVKLMFPLLN